MMPKIVEQGCIFVCLLSCSNAARKEFTISTRQSHRYPKTPHRSSRNCHTVRSEIFTPFGRILHLLSYNNRRYVLRYVGQFSDGKLDGFGVLFQESGSGRDFLDRLRPYNPDTGENLDDYLTWGNYASYFGEFSDGVKHGMGNTFNLADFYIADFSIALTQIDLDNPGFSVDVGRYKSDKLNGECQQYIGGYPYYIGECRDDQFDGYGILYYPGTGVPAYEGEFKAIPHRKKCQIPPSVI